MSWRIQAQRPDEQLTPPTVWPSLPAFFPDAMPMRFPVQLTRILEQNEVADLSESTVWNLAPLAKCCSPAKRLWSLAINSVCAIRMGPWKWSFVVAVQYQPGKTLVAARFPARVPNWIVKS